MNVNNFSAMILVDLSLYVLIFFWRYVLLTTIARFERWFIFRAHCILDILCFVGHHWVLSLLSRGHCRHCRLVLLFLRTLLFSHSLQDRCNVLFFKSRTISRSCELMWNVFVTDHTYKLAHVYTHTRIHTLHGMIVLCLCLCRTTYLYKVGRQTSASACEVNQNQDVS